MSSLIKSDRIYAGWVDELKERYRQSQAKAAVAANSHQLAYNWSVGRDIVALQFENTYGSRFYDTLSSDLRDAIPDAKGFSSTNLKYMKYFYELVDAALSGNRPQLVDDLGLAETSVIRPQLAEELREASRRQVGTNVGRELFAIPWGHIRLLIDKCKGDSDKALFYAWKILENSWSSYELSKLIPEDFRGSLPTIEEIEAELGGGDV